MTISGITPINALPLAASGINASGAAPLMAQSLPGSPLLGANLGVTEKPGLGTRLLNAMRSAISELRGTGSTLATAQTLAMQAGVTPTATAPVAISKPAVAAAGTKAKFPKAKTWVDKQGNVRQLGTGKIVKAAAGNHAAAAPKPAAPVAATPGSTLPINATQVPGATVYSYDQNGNPVAPTMQQLGMTPTMLQGLTGVANGVDPDGPQVNATNQTNLSGMGSALGLGSAVPVLGQPILTTTTQPAATTGASTGGSQTVKNENVTDVSSRNQGVDYGWGSGGWGLPFGGVATPSAPFGSSMTGAYTLGTGSRLF